MGGSLKQFDYSKKISRQKAFNVNIQLNLKCMHTMLNKHFIRILMNKKPLTYRMVVLQYREMVNGFGIQMVHKKIHKPDDCLA